MSSHDDLKSTFIHRFVRRSATIVEWLLLFRILKVLARSVLLKPSKVVQ